jgi:predicted LPLAT superfamily acyltransferase
VSEQAATWLSLGERGTLWGIRFVFRLATLFGRWPARQFLRLLALWYLLFDRKVVAASRQWFERLDGVPPTRGMVYQHILRFAHVALDRIYLLRGDIKRFDVTRTGHHHLTEALAAGKGAILLGAHLGSYEAGRASGEEAAIPLNIVGYFANAKMINALFEQLNPAMAARVIHIGDGGVGFIFDVQDAIGRGELVAVLGDRVGRGEKTVTADFLGAPARFPVGPFMLAGLLHCPVLLVFNLFTEPNRYDLYCEPFADRVDLPRQGRPEALQQLAQRYADRLAVFCRQAPDNWFNFHDFWSAP